MIRSHRSIAICTLMFVGTLFSGLVWTPVAGAQAVDCDDQSGGQADCTATLAGTVGTGDSGLTGDGGFGGSGGGSGSTRGGVGTGGPGGSGGPGPNGGGNGGDGGPGGAAGGSGDYAGATTDEDPPGASGRAAAAASGSGAGGSGLYGGVSNWWQRKPSSGSAAGGGIEGGLVPTGGGVATILLVGDATFELGDALSEHTSRPAARTGPREIDASGASARQQERGWIASLLLGGLGMVAVLRPVRRFFKPMAGAHSAAS